MYRPKFNTFYVYWDSLYLMFDWLRRKDDMYRPNSTHFMFIRTHCILCLTDWGERMICIDLNSTHFMFIGTHCILCLTDWGERMICIGLNSTHFMFIRTHCIFCLTDWGERMICIGLNSTHFMPLLNDIYETG